MTDQPRSLVPAPRDTLRAKIEAAERRNAERSLADQARTAANAAVDYTRANPLTVIGGALFVGLAIGLMTRPGRQMASRVAHSATEAVSGAASSASSGAKRLAAGGGTRIGAMLGDAVVAYLITLIDDTLDAASEGRDRAGELSETVSTKARLGQHQGAPSGSQIACTGGSRGIRNQTQGQDLIPPLACGACPWRRAR